jgi:MatE protein
MTQQSASAPSGAPASAKMSPPSAAARTKLLLEGPVLPTLLRLAAPNVLNLLAFVGVITFDGFFLGRIGTDALAGASLAFPWVMLVLQTTNSGMGAGVSSAVARALGAGRRERADDLVFHAFLLALALAAAFSTAMLLASPVIFRWMGGRDEMLADALAYANVARIRQTVISRDEVPDEFLRPADRGGGRPENDLARLSHADEHLVRCGAKGFQNVPRQNEVAVLTGSEPEECRWGAASRVGHCALLSRRRSLTLGRLVVRTAYPVFSNSSRPISM